MNNHTIRIALSSVLIYVSFKKLYDIFIALLQWVIVEFRIENEVILIALNIVIGLLSVFTLIVFGNKILSKKNRENGLLFFLIGLLAILTLCMGLVNKFYGVYLSNIELADFRQTYLIQYEWSKMLGTIFPIFGLLFFLWKMKNNNVADHTGSE